MPISALRWLAYVLLVGGVGCLHGCSSLQSAAVDSNDADTVAAGAAPSGTGPKRPSKNWLRVSQYAICSDFQLNPADPLFHELEELPGQIQSELKLPPGNSVIQVFLFDTQESYESYMTARYPKLPLRRAYFIAEPRVVSGDDLLVYTWMGSHLRTDLRHELTHAVLHSVLKSVPLWLDEGLAGYFELPVNAEGLNTNHLEIIRKSLFQPDLARLEKLGKVAQMEKPEYREAWAWTHFMLRGSPKAKEALLAFLNELQTNSNPTPLMQRIKEIHAEPEAALVDYLATLSLDGKSK
ncbi:MAG: DUF1570 domain-containing protein [Gemmataceae bacterium]